MIEIDKIKSAAQILCDRNKIGAVILDGTLDILWCNDFAATFLPKCAEDANLASIATLSSFEQVLSQTVTTSISETVIKNADGDRVLLVLIDISGAFLGLLSSGFQTANFAVGALVHDMRSPITAVKQASSALSVCSDDGTREELYGIIKRNCSTALKMIEEMLSLWFETDISAELDRKPISLYGLVGKLCKEARVILADAGISLKVDDRSGGTFVLADPDMLERAVLNIVSNAVKFARSKITITLTAENGSAEILVDNDGPPIESGVAAELFSPLKHGAGGHGIGLYTSKIIAESHGGSLTLFDSALQGVCFKFTLPAYQDSAVVCCPRHSCINVSLFIANTLLERKALWKTDSLPFSRE